MATQLLIIGLDGATWRLLAPWAREGRLPNVLLTPHVSGTSPALFWHRMLGLFLTNWERYRRGEPLVNLVDKAAGY